MTPEEILLAVAFAEKLAGLAAKTISDIKSVLNGNSAKTITQIVDDADATYNAVIEEAKLALPSKQ